MLKADWWNPYRTSMCQTSKNNKISIKRTKALENNSIIISIDSKKKAICPMQVIKSLVSSISYAIHIYWIYWWNKMHVVIIIIRAQWEIPCTMESSRWGEQEKRIVHKPLEWTNVLTKQPWLFVLSWTHLFWDYLENANFGSIYAALRQSCFYHGYCYYMIKLFHILQVRACTLFVFIFWFSFCHCCFFNVHCPSSFFYRMNLFHSVWKYMYVWPCQCLYKVSNRNVQQMPQKCV